MPGIVTFHLNKDRFIRCEFCRKYPNIVKQHIKKKPPSITTTIGTRFRGNVLSEHLDTLYHKESAKAYRISFTEEKEAGPMEIAISRANKLNVDRVVD